MNTRLIGSRFEEQACAYLEGAGYRILARNYRVYNAEIDIVAAEKEQLVFIEVKYRRTFSFGYGQEHVDKRKQHKIFLAAQQYLLRFHAKRTPPCRFDVIAIDGDGRLEHIINAFERSF